MLTAAYAVHSFDQATGQEKAFRDLVLARLTEPTSKADCVRVINEVDVPAPTYPHDQAPTARVRHPGVASGVGPTVRRRRRLGPATLVLYELSTPYLETDGGDGFREPGFSQERGLERRSPSGC